jgi:hypothetical protein
MVKKSERSYALKCIGAAKAKITKNLSEVSGMLDVEISIKELDSKKVKGKRKEKKSTKFSPISFISPFIFYVIKLIVETYLL